MTTYTSLPAFLTDMADAIRSKTGGTSPIAAGDMPTAVAGISSLNIGTATATASSTTSVSFSGLNGEPKIFFVFYESGSDRLTHSTSAHDFLSLCAYGNTKHGVYTRCNGSPNYYVYQTADTSHFSWNYTSGKLTVTVSSTSYGSFGTSNVLRLVYVY